MRKLKLQLQITVDGFVAGPEGQLDWMARDASDQDLINFIVHLTDTSDTILLGRKMTTGFVQYWEKAVSQPDSPETPFAHKMVDTPKIVFSKTVKKIDGKNIRVENGDRVEVVNKLKRAAGKDIVVYGGASFVSSLVRAGLIDEYNLFVNPVAIGNGMRIFDSRSGLKLFAATGYPSGVVVNRYNPRAPK